MVLEVRRSNQSWWQWGKMGLNTKTQLPQFGNYDLCDEVSFRCCCWIAFLLPSQDTRNWQRGLDRKQCSHFDRPSRDFCRKRTHSRWVMLVVSLCGQREKGHWPLPLLEMSLCVSWQGLKGKWIETLPIHLCLCQINCSMVAQFISEPKLWHSQKPSTLAKRWQHQLW